MNTYVLSLQELGHTSNSIAGGKGANLGELSRIKGIQVPDGFCLTTDAYKEITANNPQLTHWLNELTRLTTAKQKSIAELSAKIRTVIGNTPIPEAIAEEVAFHLTRTGPNYAYAVRSSATAEDLPTASFAGQQDTYLNIIGKEAILQHISKCWASLFTERAVSYRLQNGFDHRNIHLAVVVQKMIFPQASGILFTADPVTGNRKVLAIDASFGLGEALVAGIVNADHYKVRNSQIIDKKVSVKKLIIHAKKDGGTTQQALEPEQQNKQTLTDAQILQLEQIGRNIEAHFGSPQDIEWCLAGSTFYIVQSRPITTLYPIPKAQDAENHVYVSVGHQQMMTDAIRPLGISIWNLTAGRPMFTAGGRLFVDITQELASPARRHILVNVLGKSDPLIRDALMTILERGDFIKELPDDGHTKTAPPHNFQALNDYDPSIVTNLINSSRQSIDQLKQDIQKRSGLELLDFILENARELRMGMIAPESFGVIMTAMNAASWINEKMKEWLGEINAADTLSQSVPNNITSEMGLALLDLADVIRPHQQVLTYLQQTKDDSFLDHLPTVPGGRQVGDAIQAYLDKYGMRCAGEIDITRPRWIEKPTTLLPLLLSNVKNFEPGAGKQKFDRGRNDALKKEQELLDRLKQLPDGEEKARETKRMIDLVRNLSGYREYPKYSIVSSYLILKQALEGRARVIMKMEDANLQEGDILVTPFTDPSWTPLFLSIKGLVTEVGGLMTHGAVIAREYGLPAVVGVENAVQLIRDGQRIRVNATAGYIEIL